MNKVLFLMFCYAVLARLCHSGSDSNNKSASKPVKNKEGGLKPRVEELEDKLKSLSERVSVNKEDANKIENNIIKLNASLTAVKANMKDLKTLVSTNAACCDAVISMQEPAAAKPSTTPAPPPPYSCMSPSVFGGKCPNQRWFPGFIQADCMQNCPNQYYKGFNTLEECRNACFPGATFL